MTEPSTSDGGDRLVTTDVEAQAVLNAAGEIHASLNLGDVAAAVVQQAVGLTKADEGVLFLANETADALIRQSAVPPFDASTPPLPVAPGSGIAGWVFENRSPVLAADVGSDARFDPEVDASAAGPAATVLSVPLTRKDHVIGVLQVTGKDPGKPFTPRHTAVLQLLAHQAADAIANARAFRRLRSQLEEVRKERLQLTEAAKNRAIERLSTGISHDLINIINSIRGFSEMALMDAQDPHTREGIEGILTASDSAMELVDRIQSVSNQGHGDKVLLKFSSLIRQALKLFRIFLPDSIIIEQELSYDDYRIMADPSQIHQAITNMLKNAQEAIGDRPGKITITSNVGNLRGEDVHTAGLEQGKYVRLVIKDDGVGMDQETLNQVFDPYFSTKSRGTGTGMGLTIAQATAKNHGGALLARSAVDQGTTMILLLPIHEIESTIKPVPSPKLPTGDERILVVDDEDLLASTLARMLTTLGYHVTKVNRSKDALAFFREYCSSLDLVISDWAMPEIRGDRLAELMLEIDPDAKVVIYSAFDKDISRQRLSLPGIRAVLRKPIAMAKLAHTIRKLLDEP